VRGLGTLSALGAAAAVLLSVSPAAASSWTIVPSPPSDGGFFTAVSARTDADAGPGDGPPRASVFRYFAGRSRYRHHSIARL
jgi:hypothetical protein